MPIIYRMCPITRATRGRDLKMVPRKRRQLLTNSPLRIKAPSTLDVAFARQEGRYLVHLVNMTTDQVIEDQNCNADTYEVIPLHEIEIRVKLGQRVRRVCRASDEMELPWHREGDWVVIEYPRLDLYDIAVLEL